MSEKAVRRKKKKEEQYEQKPSDEQTAVAKYLRFKLSTKSCNFMGNKVEYFTGSKAVDFLLDSKWSSSKAKEKPLFTHRESVTKYLDILLHKGFFVRALKVVVKKKEKETKEESKKKSKKTDKEKEKEFSQDSTEKKEKKDKSKVDETADKKSKEGKRKIKLEGTQEQLFLDGSDAYVWIFDPIKPLHYVYGLGLVIGAIAICLFPLWPPWIRVGTYYLSVGGACLVGSIVVLAIVRAILYCIIYALTLGNTHCWFFPNLLADVGILESFQPFYSIELGSGNSEKQKDQQNNDGNEDDEGLDRDPKESEKEGDKIDELSFLESENTDLVSSDDKTEQIADDTDDKEESKVKIEKESGGNHDNSDNEEENVSQTSERSESSSSQGTKDFEVVTKDDVEEAAST